MLDAALDKYGENMNIEIALMIALKHGISRDEVRSDFSGDIVDTSEFISWLGY